MELVKRRNPESTGQFFDIPRSLVTLLEDNFHCKTAKKKTDGLRWEYNGTGVLVFDDIKNYGCTIYILPTGVKKWKTLEIMRKIIYKASGHELGNEAKCHGSLSEHLAIYNISWKLVEKLVPVLVKWVLENNNEGAGVVNNQSAIEKQGKYLPTKADVELVASQVPIGVRGNIDAILDKIEHNVLAAGKILQDNWRMITERNIAIWFK